MHCIYEKNSKEGSEDSFFIMEIKEKIAEIIAPLLEEHNFFVVDISMKGSKMMPRVIVLLDSDEGIQIDQCAIVSRKLGAELEAQELIATKYTLEVSSPGVDFPLLFFRQYQRQLNRTLLIKYKDGESITGKLTAIENESLTIIEDKKRKKTEAIIPVEIPFDSIKESYVQISFK